VRKTRNSGPDRGNSLQYDEYSQGARDDPARRERLASAPLSLLASSINHHARSLPTIAAPDSEHAIRLASRFDKFEFATSVGRDTKESNLTAS
jgi:hypothetical protein